MKSQAIAEMIAPVHTVLSKVVDHPSQHPQFQAALELFKGVNKTKVFFEEKYYAGQKSILLDELEALHEAHPEMSVRATVVHILQDLPDFLPPENILDVTRIIVEEWTKLSQPQPAEIASSVA